MYNKEMTYADWFSLMKNDSSRHFIIVPEGFDYEGLISDEYDDSRVCCIPYPTVTVVNSGGILNFKQSEESLIKYNCQMLPAKKKYNICIPC